MSDFKKSYSKDSIEWKFMGEFWKFIEDHGNNTHNEAYWRTLLTDANALRKKYNNSFSTELIDGYLRYQRNETKQAGQ